MSKNLRQFIADAAYENSSSSDMANPSARAEQYIRMGLALQECANRARDDGEETLAYILDMASLEAALSYERLSGKLPL